MAGRKQIEIRINLRYVAIGLAMLVAALGVREEMPYAALGGGLLAWGLYRWR